ncbi:MAG TPA: protein kinase [Kofleriaceae bacterium]
MFVCPECGATQASPGSCVVDGVAVMPVGEDLLLGTTIGAYRVSRLLGIGGMGRVYKGVHPTIGSRVAIKVLSRECSDRRDLVERFFAEAKAVNLIRHESIVNVLDLATLPDGRPYIIMEYLDGAPLASIIEAGATRGPLPLGGIARLAAEVLDALGAAHAKGIVHRDLKPDNIFVAPSGRPKVLDFGIAKLSDTSHSATRTGSLLGTPHYMSPEQAAGRPVDHRADIYAMGVILFECSTGQKPFLAESLFDLLRKHVEAPPPSPRAMRPDMPPELEHVILTALAKAPEHRFGSAQAMSMALQHATAQLPQSSWQPLTPTVTTATGAQAWSPTPPASWTPQAPQSGFSTHNATQPSPTPPSMARPPEKNRTALWVALGIVLVGGGVTAGVVAGLSNKGGGSGSGAVATSDGSATNGGVGVNGGAGGGATNGGTGENGGAANGAGGNGGAGGGGAANGGATGGGATNGGAGTNGATNGGAGGNGGAQQNAGNVHIGSNVQIGQNVVINGSAAQPTKVENDGDEDDDGLDAAMASIDQAMAQLGPEGMKQLPPEMQQQLAQLKAIRKLPKNQREAKLRELMTSGPLAGMGAIGIAKPPPPPPPPASGGWVKYHTIPLPPGFDPSNVDVAATIRWAEAQARAAIPDAVMFRIDTTGISPDGRANLNLASSSSDHGSIDVRFMSPSRSKRDPKLPLGVRVEWKCMFRVAVEPGTVTVSPLDGWDCNEEHVVPWPRCSFAQIWKKAIAKKAPSSNAVASVDYRSNSDGQSTWYFDIGFGTGGKNFSELFQDDCR